MAAEPPLGMPRQIPVDTDAARGAAEWLQLPVLRRAEQAGEPVINAARLPCGEAPRPAMVALQGLEPEALLQGLLRVLNPDQLAELVKQLAPAAQGAAASSAPAGGASAAQQAPRSPIEEYPADYGDAPMADVVMTDAAALEGIVEQTEADTLAIAPIGQDISLPLPVMLDRSGGLLEAEIVPARGHDRVRSRSPVG